MEQHARLGPLSFYLTAWARSCDVGICSAASKVGGIYQRQLSLKIILYFVTNRETDASWKLIRPCFQPKVASTTASKGHGDLRNPNIGNGGWVRWSSPVRNDKC